MAFIVGYNEAMKLAAIDIGSNTIRLLVATVTNGKITPLRHERRVTRLASGLHISGVIDKGKRDITTRVVREYARIARDEGARRVIVAATSALREALNSDEFVKDIEISSGLHVDIISGQQEAETMSKGVISGLGTIEKAIIFDIGGGSTEFVALERGAVMNSCTFPVGVVRMMEESVHSDPPSESDIKRLNDCASIAASGVREGFMEFVAPGCALIGTAGTATTLASLDLGLDKYDWQRVQGHILHLGRLRELETLLLSTTLNNRRKIKGMDQERTDLIIAGTRITIRIMEALGFDNMMVSDHGLLEGLVIKLSLEAEK